MKYKLSMAEVTTKKWTFEEDVGNYCQYGYDAISVWLDKLGEYGIERATELLGRYPIEVSSLVFTGQYPQPTEDKRQKRIRETMEHIEIASKIGARFICVVPGVPAPKPNMTEELSYGLSDGEGREMIVEALRTVSPLAEEKGINLAVEPLNRERMKFVCSLEEVLEIVRLVNSPRVGILLDTYQLGLEKNVVRSISQLKGDLFLLDVSDRSLQTPETFEEYPRLGDGAVPLVEIIAAVRKIGYKGYYNIEIFSREMWESDYIAILQECKKRFGLIWEKSQQILNKA